jgi:hypothetical protein
MQAYPKAMSVLPVPPESVTATFVNDTAILSMDSDATISSQKLQTNLAGIQNWYKKWRTKDNGFKLVHGMVST